MDIQVASIGALKWRGNLPPEDEPKTAAGEWLETAADVVRAWIDRRTPQGSLAQQIGDLLGVPTACRQAIASEFFLEPPPGTGFCDWLVASAKEAGTRVEAVFAGGQSG